MIALCRRFASLDRSRRRLVIEAAAFITLAWAGLRLIRFLTLRRIFERCIALSIQPGPADPNAVDAIRWAIRVVAARWPSATCLPQALAADAMLRRRRIASAVRFGITVNPARDVPISGHAWVECLGGATIGAVDEQTPLEVLSVVRSA